MPRPTTSPVQLPSLICTNCSKRMRTEINSMANGRLIDIFVFCDECKYGDKVSPDHSRTEPSKYVTAAEWKEKREKEAKAAADRAKQAAEKANAQG